MPPTIVVEVLNAHHMIITFFHIPASWHGSPERFFWKGGWKKEMVSDICWAAGPKAVEVRRPELHFFQRNAHFLVFFVCAFPALQSTKKHKSYHKKYHEKKHKSYHRKKHNKNTSHTTIQILKKTQFIPKNKKHTSHTTTKSTKQKHQSWRFQPVRSWNCEWKYCLICFPLPATTNHSTKNITKKTQFIPQKKCTKNRIHTSKKSTNKTKSCSFLFLLQFSVFPHLPGEGCWILSELLPASSSSSSTSCPHPRRPPPRLLLQFLLDHVCINFHLHFRLANSSPSSSPTSQLSAHCWTSTWELPSSVHRWTSTSDVPAQCAPLDFNLGPFQLSAHRWTSTCDFPSSARTAGPQPGTFRAQCAPLDLNLDLPSSVRTAGPQRPDRMPEDMPDRMSDRMPEDMPDRNARRYAR